MSKPAASAVAQLHKCPKTSEEIRVKGFAFCPFCGEAINADGDHNVVIQKPDPPKPKPEPAPPAPPRPDPAPQPAAAAAPISPFATTTLSFEEAQRTAATKARVAEIDAEVRAAEAVLAASGEKKGRPKEPGIPAVPLLILAAAILGGGYFAWTQTQTPPPPAPVIEQAQQTAPEPVGPPPAERDMTDTGRKINPDITSAGRTLTPRSVDNGLVREIRYNNANIRALPTVNSKIVAQLQRGAIIRPAARITDLRGVEEGEWYRIDEPASGYVRFGNTRPPTQAAAKPDAPRPAVTVIVSPVEAGLRARARIKLRIRSTPSRLNNANFTDSHIEQGALFSPQGIADDAGKDPGKQWYKVPGGFVAEWETDALTPTSAPASPAPEIDAGDRGQSSSNRARDALQQRLGVSPN